MKGITSHFIQCELAPASPPRRALSPQRLTLLCTLPHWHCLGLLPPKGEEKEGYLFNTKEEAGRSPVLSVPQEERCTCACACAHAASTYLQSPFPEGTCRHVNLRSASSLLLLIRASWPFSSSQEHCRGRWQPPGSRHLTHWIIHKTETSQGWRLRSLCAAWTQSRAHPGPAFPSLVTHSSLPAKAAHFL